MDTDKLIFAIIGGFTLIVLVVIMASSLTKKPVDWVGEPGNLIGENPHYKGVSPDQAELTIVEFSDFTCPYCSQYPPILNGLAAEYEGRLSVVYRHFPLHGMNGSLPTAWASEAADLQGKFWEMHDELFANQPQFSQEEIWLYAQNLDGIEIEKFKSDYASVQVRDRVAVDSQVSKDLRLSGTPSFYFIIRTNEDTKIEKWAQSAQETLNDKVAEILGDRL